MTTPKPITTHSTPDAYKPESPAEQLEEDALVGGVAVVAALRATAIAFVVLLVCWPLAILAVVVVAPLLVIALVLGLLAVIVSVPYLLFQHFHGHHGGHLSLLAHRLRRAARALIDLAPHRIVADARKLHPGR
jgi:hypothetical protein